MVSDNCLAIGIWGRAGLLRTALGRQARPDGGEGWVAALHPCKLHGVSRWFATPAPPRATPASPAQ